MFFGAAETVETKGKQKSGFLIKSLQVQIQQRVSWLQYKLM